MKIKTNSWLFASQKSTNLQSIWLKEKKPLKQSDLNNLQVTPSYFQKRTKTFKRLVKRYYYIANNNLYYCEKQKSTSIKGMLDLSLVYAEFYESKVKILKNNTYIICLRQDSSFVELLTENKQIFTEWCAVLRRCCIMVDFHNQFNILKMIGKGGFSRVFLAQDKFSRENYAIKVITKDKLLQQTKGIKSLLNEIQIMKDLNDVNGCLKLIGVYETDSSVNLILEYIKGGELDKQNLTIESMRQLMQNILVALAHIHQRKIIHRDLKPDNILIEDDISSNKVKIADFGLATYDSTILNDFLFKKCGTPGFLAPEVLSNKDTHKLYDQKVDVFSAGVIFYILLCGQQPFKGSNHRQVVEQNKKCEIDFQILDQNQKIPQAAKILVKQMLSKDPLNRPTSQECLNNIFFKENILNNSFNLDLNNYDSQKFQSLDGLNKLKIESLDRNSQNDLYWVNPIWKGQTNTVQTVTKLSSIYIQINDVRKRNKSNFAPMVNAHAEESKDDDSGMTSSVREKRSASADYDFRNKYMVNQSLHITVLKKNKQGDDQTNNDNAEVSIDNNIDSIEENFENAGFDSKNYINQLEQQKGDAQLKKQLSDSNNNINLKVSIFKKSQFLDSNREDYKPSLKSSAAEGIENEPGINQLGLDQNIQDNLFQQKTFNNMGNNKNLGVNLITQVSYRERQENSKLSNFYADEKGIIDDDYNTRQYSSNRSIEYNLKKNEALENHCQKVNHIKIKLRDFNSLNMIQQIAAPNIFSKDNQNYNQEIYEDEQIQFYSRQGIRNSTLNQNSCQEADFRVSEVEENISSRHFTTINRNLIFRYNPFDCNVCL